MITVSNTGIYFTLISQLDKLARHNRHGSYKTRERYCDAMKRFCAFLADEYRLEKLSNISGKHLTAYVNRLQERGRAAAYIKTELSAIRLFHDLIPAPRYKLPGNDELDLERRRFGEVDRTWSQTELEAMCQEAVAAGREDFADMLTLIRHTGMRLHECARLDTAAAAGAARRHLLTVKGKGGKFRDIPLDETAVEILKARATQTSRGKKLFIPDEIKTDVFMQQLEQFIYTRGKVIRPDSDRAGLTVHGLRHGYAAERYKELITAGHSELDARRIVSRWLGHGRDSVTKIYLASLSEDVNGGGGAL